MANANLYLQKYLEELLSETVFQEKVDPLRTLKLRFSGLPFCGLRWTLQMKNASSKNRSMDFMFKYYTSVGTLIHTLFQKAFSQESSEFKVWRDYICLDCNHRISLSPKLISSCPSCKSKKIRTDEHEIEFEGMLGHTDEIISIVLRNKEKLMILLDYKSTSMSNIASVSGLVTPEYKFQLEGYAAVLREQGIPITHRAFVFIPRDNPTKLKIVDLKEVKEASVQKNLKSLRSQKADHTRWLKFLSLGKPNKVESLIESRPCSSESQPDHFKKCKFSDMCKRGEMDEISANVLTVYPNASKHILELKEIYEKSAVR